MAPLTGEWVLGIDGAETPDKGLIGGKAWSIAHIAELGLSVPPAFVITTRACACYLSSGALGMPLQAEIASGMAWLEARTGRAFGSGPRPLLVSVRSGAPISMPGMMDTVLNLGITDRTEAMLAEEFGDRTFARDTHRRFLEHYAQIVLKEPTVELEVGAEPATWRRVIAEATTQMTPLEPHEQLLRAVGAVFTSWNSRRARRYREHHGIPHNLGTAVTVQAMVFGNMDERSGAGVLFTRNPLTGDPAAYGEYLPQAQGEDIVSGVHNPLALEAMRELAPEALNELLAAARRLEEVGRDVQDIEFTVESGKLYLLQTRVAKRAPRAAVRIAVDMVVEGRISEEEALQRVSTDQIRAVLSPHLQQGAAERATVAARGEPACPGVGSGVLVLDSDEAETLSRRGERVVLGRMTTSPEDLHGMIAARAIVTERGGTTSHAAAVSRALGRPCVVGCGEGVLVRLAGKVVTVDGQTGKIFFGDLPIVTPSGEDDAALVQISQWASERAPITITAKSPPDVRAIDIDGVGQEVTVQLASLDPGATVRGSLFAHDDAAVRAAITAHVAGIVTAPVLPAILAAAQAACDL